MDDCTKPTIHRTENEEGQNGNTNVNFNTNVNYRDHVNFSDHLWISAPMVRVSVLPFRLTCLEYGADLVYSEEIVASRIIDSARIENPDFKTIEYRSLKDGGLVFATNRHDQQRVIFQLGVSDAESAVRAAKHVLQDVRGIDVNMGCPKSFSVKNGMGAALLENPATAEQILRSLRNVIPKDKIFTCKIRLLESIEKTVQFALMCESCGIDALIVHARLKSDRPSTSAQWKRFAHIKSKLSIPLVANGDFLNPSSVASFLDHYHNSVDSLMFARGSLRNPSIFTLKKHLLKHLKNKEAQLMLTVETSKSHDNSCDEPVAEGIDLTSHVSSFSLNTCLASPCFNLVDPIDCMRKVLQHALVCGNIFQSMKWLILEMLNEVPDLTIREKVQLSKTTMKLMETFSLHHEYVHLLRAHPNWSEDVHTKFYFRNKRQFSLAFQPIIQPQQEQPQNEETVPCLDVPCPSVQCTTSPADVVDLSSVKRTKTILSYEVAPVPNGFSVPDFSVQSQQSG